MKEGCKIKRKEGVGEECEEKESKGTDKEGVEGKEDDGEER